MQPPKNRVIRNQKNGAVSRREFLALLGIGGAGIGAACAGVSLTAFILYEHQQRRNAPTSTPVRLQINDVQTIATRPDMISRADWGALPPDLTAVNEHGYYSLENPEGWRVYAEELTDAYQTAVIHHSVTYAQDDLSTVRDIQITHRDQRGWADIGYHYLVGKSGAIYEGRDINVRGTHVENYNTGSVGVCLLGNFVSEAPTAAQITATYDLLAWLSERLQLTNLAGHDDFNNQTQCPGTNLIAYLPDFADFCGLEPGIGGYLPPPEQQITPSAYSGCACGCCVDV